MKLENAKENFIEHLKRKDRAHSTIIAYDKDVEQLFDYIRDDEDINNISSIKTEHLRDYVKKLKTDKSKDYTLKTVSRKINSMKTFFKFLFANGLVKSDISIAVEHPKYEVAPPRVLSKLEYRALRDVARYNVRLYAIVELLLQTGIRIGELARLKLSDIINKGKKKELKISSYASHESRNIDLNKAADMGIQDYLKIRPESNDEVDNIFITKNGNPLLVRNIRSSINRAFEKAGIENATVNDIRNTFIVYQLKQGMSPKQVAELVGHKRITSTKKYLELIDTTPEKKSKSITQL